MMVKDRNSLHTHQEGCRPADHNLLDDGMLDREWVSVRSHYKTIKILMLKTHEICALESN